MRAVRHIRRRSALAALAFMVSACAAHAEPGGPAIVVKAQSSSCPDTRPATLPDVPGPAMVPGTPTMAWGCRYQGLNDPHPNTLVRSAHVTGDQVTKLVSTLNSAVPWPPNLPCPMDVGLYDLVVFGYPSGNPVTVQVSVTGCASATNGHKTVRADGDLLGQLTSMVGASRIAPR